MKNILLTAMLALFAILLFGGCAAVNSNGSRIIAGGEYVLHSGESFEGDLLVLGGNSTLEQGSRVNGSLNVIGGNTNANGEITGNISVIGGNVNLGPAAFVGGSVSTSGGNFTRASGAQIAGGMFTNAPFQGTINFPVLTVTPLMLLGWLLLRSLAEAALAAFIVLLWPESVKRTARAVVEHPVGAGVVGLAVMLLLPLFLLFLVITLLGIPVAIVGAAAFVVALVFGWIALGMEAGERLGKELGLKWAPAALAALGTFLLLIVFGAIEMIPIIGGLTNLVVSMVAIGAVVLTRFGTRTYAPPSNEAMPPPLPQGRPA